MRNFHRKLAEYISLRKFQQVEKPPNFDKSTDVAKQFNLGVKLF